MWLHPRGVVVVVCRHLARSKAPAPSSTTPDDGLNGRQRAFVAEYLANGHVATRAAIAAGYSAKSAAQSASEILKYPKVQAAIAAIEAPRLERLHLTADRLDEELARLVYLDPRRACDADGRLLRLHEMPEDVARALPGLDVEALYEWVDDPGSTSGKKQRVQVGQTTKVRWPDKTRALELAMKRLALLTEKHEHSGEVRQVSISINGKARG